LREKNLFNPLSMRKVKVGGRRRGIPPGPKSHELFGCVRFTKRSFLGRPYPDLIALVGWA
jgi:hypothetical protein